MRRLRLLTIALVSGLILSVSFVAFAQNAQNAQDAQNAQEVQNAQDAGPSADLQTKIGEFRTEQAAIQGEVDAVKAANANATQEEMNAAVQAWMAENADRIQAQQELMSQIRAELQQQFKAALGEQIQARKNARERMRANFEGLNEEQRQQYKEQIKAKIRKGRGQD